MYCHQVGFILDMQGWFDTCKLINAINHIKGFKRQNPHDCLSRCNKNLNFRKIQHAFMIKVLESVRLEEMHLSIIKIVHDRYTANIYAKWKKNQPYSNQEEDRAVHYPHSF